MMSTSEKRQLVHTTLRIKQGIKIVHCMLSCLHDVLYKFVLNFFKSLNGKVETNLTQGYMEQETTEHFRLLIKVLKWLVSPASVIYILISFYYFKINAIDSAFLGIVTFFYSNFLPDLPAMFCRYRNNHQQEKLPWYTRYALMLFTPFFVWLVFSGVSIRWRPLETFHNLKASGLYTLFLFIIGGIIFNSSIEACAFSLYGFVGYLTHLRVDHIL
jgi:hypothetical protein